jgi:hypothetical protein
MGSIEIPLTALREWVATGKKIREVAPMAAMTTAVKQAQDRAIRVRRVQQVQTLDGRVIMQDFDFESPRIMTTNGTNLDVPVTAQKQKPSVATVMADEDFKLACLAAGVEISRRQASKFRKGHGAAFAAQEKRRLAALAYDPTPVLEGRAPRPRDGEEV